MPTVFVIEGYKFFFYSNEGIPLKAPHIHVRSADGEAKISLLCPFPVLDSSGYSATELRLIQLLVKKNNLALLGAYDDYFA